MTVNPEEVGRRLDQASEICRRRDVHFTGIRREMLSLILEADRPVGAYDLLDKLKETRKKAAPPTIYRALEFLRTHGLIHRIESLNAFIACSDAGRHDAQVQLLICRLCGSVDELRNPKIAEAVEQAAAVHGFSIDLANIEIKGICRRCPTVSS